MGAKHSQAGHTETTLISPSVQPRILLQQQKRFAVVSAASSLERKASFLKKGYRPRSASLRRLGSIHRRRILEGKAGAPSRRSALVEAESEKIQEEKLLLAACARGDLKKVENLVDSGVDVNSADASQMTALHYAAMHARDEVIKLLLSWGAEANATDLKGGFTAMHWVVINAESCYGAMDHVEKSLTALA